MEFVTNNEKDFQNFLEEFFQKQGLQEDLVVAFARRICLVFETEQKVSGVRAWVNRWVIRNDDLKLLETLVPSIVSIVTAIADPSSSPARYTALITTLTSTLIIVKRAKKYSIELSDKQYKVLMALNSMGRKGTLEDIQKNKFVDEDSLRNELPNILKQMSEIRTSAGEVRSIVELDKSGEWHLLDI